MTGWSIFGDYVKANKLRSNLPFVWYFKAGLQGDDDDNNNNNNCDSDNDDDDDDDGDDDDENAFYDICCMFLR